MQLFLELLALVFGFVLLGKGAGCLVDGGVTLARRWGVSPLIVGLTIVAWGTSMPEVVVTGLAAWNGDHGVALNTVLGSNVANIGLVLGGTAYLLPALFGKTLTRRDGLWLLGSLAVLYGVAQDRDLSRLDGAILLGSFVVFQVLLLLNSRQEDQTDEVEEEKAHLSSRPGLAVLLGSIAIAAGAKFVMYGGEALATRADVPKDVIAFTVFALGTSLPELAAGVGSALRGHAEIGVGNVVGSNVFNVLAAVGIAVLIQPTASVEADPTLVEMYDHLLNRDIFLAAAFSLFLVVSLLVMPGKLRRLKSTVLFAGYVVYCGWILMNGQPG
jgi:cation:H+ antiporter